jgi:hypothetical protein
MRGQADDLTLFVVVDLTLTRTLQIGGSHEPPLFDDQPNLAANKSANVKTCPCALDELQMARRNSSRETSVPTWPSV